AMPLDQALADSFDFRAHPQLADFYRHQRFHRLMQRAHVRTPAIAVGSDDLKLALADEIGYGARFSLYPDLSDRRYERLLCFDEVDVGVPEGIVCVEDEI